MPIIGVTGGLGTGKSSVSSIFKKLGAGLIDADKVTHNLLARNSPVYKKTVLRFGKAILNKNKSINRDRLADIVFDNPGELSAYLKIIHPEIKRIIRRQIEQSKFCKRAKVIVLDAPLLIETGLRSVVDKLVVVKTNKKIQALRLKRKFGINESRILKRIKFQLPLSKKIKFSRLLSIKNL